MANTEYTEKQKAYIKKLRGVDWFACMSDDGSVARRGAAHEAEVRAEGKRDPELEGMYEKYRNWRWKHVDRGPDPFEGVE